MRLNLLVIKDHHWQVENKINLRWLADRPVYLYVQHVYLNKYTRYEKYVKKYVIFKVVPNEFNNPDVYDRQTAIDSFHLTYIYRS